MRHYSVFTKPTWVVDLGCPSVVYSLYSPWRKYSVWLDGDHTWVCPNETLHFSLAPSIIIPFIIKYIQMAKHFPISSILPFYRSRPMPLCQRHIAAHFICLAGYGHKSFVAGINTEGHNPHTVTPSYIQSSLQDGSFRTIIVWPGGLLLVRFSLWMIVRDRSFRGYCPGGVNVLESFPTAHQSLLFLITGTLFSYMNLQLLLRFLFNRPCSSNYAFRDVDVEIFLQAGCHSLLLHNQICLSTKHSQSD